MSFVPRGFEFGDRALWNSFRMGSFINWTNNIPFGTDVYNTNKPNPVFPIAGWAPAGIDVNDWVDFAASIGIEYLALTVKHNMGWWLYPFTTDITPHTGKDSYNATISLPQVATYGVNNPAIVGTADQDIIHRFVARCETNGIKPVLYYNIGKDINARGGFLTIAESAFSSDTDISDGYPLYTAMVEAHMQELLTAFPNVWLWLDAVAWYPRTAHQSLFDCIRTYGNQNTLIIYNYPPISGSSDGVTLVTKPTGTSTDYPGTLIGTSMYVWPFDVASYEYTRVPTNTSNEMGKIQSHFKHVYWRGAETSSPLFTGGQWFWWDPAVVGGTPNVLESLANLEARADVPNGNAAPFMISMCPDGSGVVSAAQKTRLTDLAAHIFP